MNNIPRLHFAHLPTPIEELPNLSKALGGPRILVKRDDQTGLAFGGNKTRKLEFLIAEADNAHRRGNIEIGVNPGIVLTSLIRKPRPGEPSGACSS